MADGKLNTQVSTHGYFSQLCVPVASASGCQHLRSASTGLLQVPRLWTTIGRQSFAIADHLCGTVFLLLYGDQRWHSTLSSDNWRPICSTPDMLANISNIHHHPALLRCFCDSGTRYKTADLRAIQTDQFSGTSSRCQSNCTSKLACVSCHWY